MVEYIRESKENKTWTAVNVNAIRKACREDDKPGRKRNERIQQRNVHRLPEQRSVLAYIASEMAIPPIPRLNVKNAWFIAFTITFPMPTFCISSMFGLR